MVCEVDVVKNVQEQELSTVLATGNTEIACNFGDVVIRDSTVQVGNENIFNNHVTIKKIVLPANSATDKPESSNHTWCQRERWIVLSVAALLLAITLIFFLVKILFKEDSHILPIYVPINQTGNVYNSTENGLKFVSRVQWAAQPPNGLLGNQTAPATTVIFAHTGEILCSTISHCIYIVRNIQTEDIDKNRLNDIRHNFLIGGDGAVYVGLGWGINGNHTDGYNERSVDIVFIGNYTNYKPADKQLKAAALLIENGIENGKLVKNYVIYAQCQLANVTSPGLNLYKTLTSWPHFNNTLKCVF